MFNVTAVLLGNPIVSPFSQRMTAAGLSKELGVLDSENMAQV